MLYPTRHFGSIYNITSGFLKELGIKALVLDIDNTLVTYGTPTPPKEVKDWINGMISDGIGITIASNNHKARVELFCSELDVFYTYDSKKPSSKCIKLSCERFKTEPEHVAVVGDQIFTDVLCARRGHAKSFLVTPLNSPESIFIRFKRLLEKPIISSYKRRHPEEFTEEKNDT